jgi:hypothetical protein
MNISKKSGFVSIDPYTHYLFLCFLWESHIISSDMIDENYFINARSTENNIVKETYQKKVQYFISIGIIAFEQMMDAYISAIKSEMYDENKVNAKEVLDDMMRYMYAIEYFYKVDPNTPIDTLENIKLGSIVRQDDTIKFNLKKYQELVQELNDIYLTNPGVQTFVPISSQDEHKIFEYSQGFHRSLDDPSKLIRVGPELPITYISSFILKCIPAYYEIKRTLPNSPQELSIFMMGILGTQLSD